MFMSVTGMCSVCHFSLEQNELPSWYICIPNLHFCRINFLYVISPPKYYLLFLVCLKVMFLICLSDEKD